MQKRRAKPTIKSNDECFYKSRKDRFFLDDDSNGMNKANGYRSIQGLGIGEGLSLSIPRDRLGEFKPLLLSVIKEQQSNINELFFEWYSKGLSTQDREQFSESIDGQRLSKS